VKLVSASVDGGGVGSHAEPSPYLASVTARSDVALVGSPGTTSSGARSGGTSRSREPVSTSSGMSRAVKKGGAKQQESPEIATAVRSRMSWLSPNAASSATLPPVE
jgi:hypothetical protein